MKAKTLHVSYKIQKITIAFVIIISIICIRLLYLQVTRGDYFLKRSTKNFLRTEKIPSHRGNILDCNGILLATNRPLTSVYWQGTGNSRLTETQYSILTRICTILNLDPQKELPLIQTHERTHKKKFLASDISFAQISQIEEQLSAHTNIFLQTKAKRYYPYGSYASHAIGYLGNIHAEPLGIMGLEKLYHDTLKGCDGTLLKTINSFGRNLAQKEIEKGAVGKDVHTTLNIALQTIAEEVFPTDFNGSFIMMNPNDGAIRTLISRPGFDPNIFLDPLSTTKWEDMQSNHPFLNRAFYASYPFGSVFKLVTISAAIEHGMIDPDATWTCKGFFHFGNRKYWCNRRWGHGELTTSQAMAQSCNIPFFDIGSKIDIDILADYAHRFGLGYKTGITLPEKDGLIPSHAWKREYRHERWWQGETLSVAIGQSFLLATPIQAARMIGSIFTGYLVKPRIIESEPITCQPLAIEQKTRAFLQKSMKSVIKHGTGSRINTIKDIEIYAKTSTAQVSEFGKRKKDNKHLEHAWFVAHVSYKHHEPFTLVIVIENAGSTRSVITVAKDFLIHYKNMMDEA